VTNATDQRNERHPLDLFSLLAGIVFLGIGVALMVTESALDSDADLGWIVAALLVGLGLAGALGSLVRTRPRDVVPAPDRDTEDSALDDSEPTDQHDTDQEEVSP
jgi:hypothetical protein